MVKVSKLKTSNYSLPLQQVNKTLKILRMGHNPLENQGSFILLKAVKNNAETALEELYLTNILVRSDFYDLMNEYHEKNPGLRITCDVPPALATPRTSAGSKPPGLDNEGEKKSKKNYLLTILKNYLIEKRLRAVDLFNCLDKEKSQALRPEDMFKGLRNAKIPLTDAQLIELISLLDKNNNGEVDYCEFSVVNQ